MWIPTTQENVVGGGGAMELICDSTLGSDQASFDTNTILGGDIPSTYKHLVLEMVLRSDRAANTTDNAKLQFNADTTSANYKTQRLNATGSSVTTSSFDGTQPGVILGETTAASAPASSFGQMSTKINNYLSTSHHKMAQAQSIAYADSSGPVLLLDSQAGIWLNTAAVTRIVVAPLNGSNWKTGSRFTLYGLG